MPAYANNETARARGNWQGMNWIRQEKRLAIYLRDGLACGWCGFSLEDGAQLTLDHLRPHSLGGSNDADNLVTACKRCNDSRGDRSQAAFARAVAGYVGGAMAPQDILTRVRNAARRELAPYRQQAAAMIALRGSAAKALASTR